MMKKLFFVLCLAFLTGCGAAEISTVPIMTELATIETELPTETESPTETALPFQPIPDIDLTAMSGTMVYSQVFDMIERPEDYLDTTVRMQGNFAIYHDEVTDVNYYACLIADATACCSQGLEFVLAGDPAYPEGYPEIGEEITVLGNFQIYEDYGYRYCHLVDAVIE